MTRLRRVAAGCAAWAAAVTGAGASSEGELQWAYATQGAVVSSAAVAPDGTIYVGSEGRRLWAIAPDGSTRWYWPAVPDGPQLVTDWFDAAPAIGPDGTIYAGNFDGRLYAISASGVLRWMFDTGTYIVSSAAIGPDGAVYFGAGDGCVYALDPDGSARWIFATGDWVDSSPAIGGDGSVYFGSWDGFVYAVDHDGVEKWTVATGDAVLSSPAIGADGTVYVGSSDGLLYAITPAGVVRWTFRTGDVIDASPAVGPDGTVYCGSADGYFYAVRPDGTSAWPAPFFVGQGVFGGVTVRDDGTLLFGANDRRIYALGASGTLQWSFATADIVDVTPAIGPDGTIYVGSYDQKLYALQGNGSGLGSGPWPKFRRDALNRARMPEPTDRVEAPVITLGPQSQTVDYGTEAAFAVVASGTQPLAYRWFKDGTEIAGAVLASLAIPEATPADAGSYHVVVANAAGSDASADAVLTVNPAVPPTIINQPRPLTLVPGQRLCLWVNAAGTSPLEYTWSRNGVPLAGASGSCYTVDAATTEAAGSYAVVVANPAGVQTSTSATVTFNATGRAQVTNLSTRAFVGLDDSILIPGFVIQGTASRRLLIRAVGPTLALDPFHVPGVLRDPTLTIYSGQIPVATNDNWAAAANAPEIESTSDSLLAFALDPLDLDAAALVDLSPGAYTVHVSGVGNTTGVALVEVYDVSAATAASGTLVNISARALARTGADILIGGFSLSGNVAKTILIRGIGPELGNPAFGVVDVLADPRLSVFQGATEIIANDDWMDQADAAACPCLGRCRCISAGTWQRRRGFVARPDARRIHGASRRQRWHDGQRPHRSLRSPVSRDPWRSCTIP